METPAVRDGRPFVPRASAPQRPQAVVSRPQQHHGCSQPSQSLRARMRPRMRKPDCMSQLRTQFIIEHSALPLRHARTGYNRNSYGMLSLLRCYAGFLRTRGCHAAARASRVSPGLGGASELRQYKAYTASTRPVSQRLNPSAIAARLHEWPTGRPPGPTPRRPASAAR